MRAALYVRKSTTGDKLQADSLEVQEQILRAFADARGIEVAGVFRDAASGTTADRPSFAELVRQITSGRSGFEAILVRDVSRFGRFFEPDEAAYWSYLFELHGVRTIYAEEMFTDDHTPLAGLVKAARRVMAAEFSREKSRLVSRSQERVTQLGFLRGGPPPYGMRRMMVTRAGDSLRVLEHGEWKALATNRTKLEPGDPREVAVVREIFERYARGESLNVITDDLNRRQIPGAHGGKWWEPTVAAILRNPVYSGAAVFTSRKGDARRGLPSHPKRIERPGAYRAIVDPETWAAVVKRRDARTDRRTNEELAVDLRAAYEQSGYLGAPTCARSIRCCSWATYRNRFSDSHDGALKLAYRQELDGLRPAIAELLGAAGVVTQHSDWDFDVDGAARVHVDFAFRRMGKRVPYWRFHVENDAMLTLGVAVHAPPLRVEGYYLVRSSLRRKTLGLTGRDGRSVSSRITSRRGLRARFRRLYYGTSDAERRFLDAARSQPVLILSRLSRELGWSVAGTSRMYRKLLKRGAPMPPLKYKAGRRLRLTCCDCGASELTQPSRAIARTKHRCARCRGKVRLECPVCRRVAWRWPSSVRKLSDGARSTCRRCRSRTMRVESLRKGGNAAPPETTFFLQGGKIRHG